MMPDAKMAEKASTASPKPQRDGGESLWSQVWWELSFWGRSCRQYWVMDTGTLLVYKETGQLLQRDIKDTEMKSSVSRQSSLCTFPVL